MSRTVILFTLLISVWANSQLASAFERPKLTPNEITTLEAGEAIISVWKDRTHERKPTISRGGIDIMASAAKVFAVMLNCDRMLEVSPDIRECEVLETSETGDWDIRKQKFAVSPLLPKFSSTFRTDYTSTPNGSHIMTIQRISGDLKVQEGRWDIISLGPMDTRVIYQAALKPAFPVPGKIIRKQVATGIPEILRNLRDVTEADHRTALQNASMPKASTSPKGAMR